MSPMFFPRGDGDAVRQAENEAAAAAAIASGTAAERALEGAGATLPGETDEDVVNVTIEDVSDDMPCVSEWTKH